MPFEALKPDGLGGKNSTDVIIVIKLKLILCYTKQFFSGLV